jgi:mono/diheme cytochrome c family protein
MRLRIATSREHRGGGWPRARGAFAALAAALSLLAGCRSEMYEQPRYEPLESSSFFDDGKSSRPLVAGTVPREDARGAPPKGADEDVFYTGWQKGKLAETVPFPVDRALLERGQERYRIYCVPCHAESGDGRGMIVRRGFNQPPPYYSEELRNQPIGHFFDVMTRGYGTMYSYATRVPPRDRWAIAAYIRVLQLSQHAEAADLSEEDRRQLSNEGTEGQGQGGNESRRAQP